MAFAKGFHLKLSNRLDVLARLARGDVNMPDYDGFSIESQVPEVKFEVAVYQLLRSAPDILASRLLYYRIPVQHAGVRLDIPQDIMGRRLLLFEKAEGDNNVWRDLSSDEKVCAYVFVSHQYFVLQYLTVITSQDCLLAQAACIRASLFNFQLPLDFAAAWLRERLFEQKPKSLPIPVAPTRAFCVSLFSSKIEATIGKLGDMIGWEDDHNTVGPIAVAAKQSLLQLIPHILPADSASASLYRLVLEHGDFGIHNMSITMDANGQPLVTSLYDWETGCIVPALLSDPLMAVSVDLVADENGEPAIIRVPGDATPDDRAEYMTYARQYLRVRFDS